MMPMRSAPAIALVAIALAAGCGPMRGPGEPVSQEVFRPDEVLAAHNAWADSIRTIWARADLRLNLPRKDQTGEPMQFDLEGHLFLEKPDRLFVHGAVLGQEVTAIGVNAEKFWLWVKPRVNTVWVGRRGGEGERRFILTPGDLAAALGVFPIGIASDSQAVFVAQARHYVLSEERQVAGERVPVRRIWFDRASLRPVRIDLYDDAGDRIVMAELMAYEKAGGIDICTVYRIRFYGDEEVDLVLRLSDVDLAKRPNEKVFEYRVPPGAKEENLDTQVEAK
jgi:hypothetical protein